MSVRDEFLKEQRQLELNVNPNRRTFIGDSVVNDDYGFFSNALEFIDTRVHKPLANFFWYRDLPYKMAGGAVEYASFYKTNYSYDEQSPIASGQNNVLLTVNVQYQKTTTRVSAFSLILKVGLVDSMKADKMALNIYQDLDDGVLMKWNTMMDSISFFGLPGLADSYGLFNNPNVYVKAETSTAWASQDGVTFFNNISALLLKAISDSAYDARFTPNRILVPMALFTQLAAPLTVVGSGSATATTGISLFNYIKQNLAFNFAGYDGGVDIFANPYLASIGTNNTGRIVIYRYDEELVRGIMGMELTRGATLFDPSSVAYKTTFVSFVGEPQFVYIKPIIYYDNKAA
jgi:hypothetical protein